jgi:alkylation response protein AidB-like acyl-CoA dehydrogenase
MRFELLPAHEALRQRARRFADEVLRPGIAQWDDAGEMPLEHFAELARRGLLVTHWPIAGNGAAEHAADTLAFMLVIEELARVSPAHAIALSVHSSLVGLTIHAHGTPAQKARWLEPMARGEFLAAFALTEREAGSDAGALTTRAVKDGADWVLTGEKIMVTNGGPAGLVLALASTDPAAGARGVTAFLVPGDAPGLERGAKDRTLGLRPADVRALVFDGVRLPDEARLGTAGQGLKLALAALDVGRIGVAAQSTGIAAEMVDRAIAHARTRRQFGQELAKLGGVIEMLAELGLARDVARLLTHDAATARDRGEPFGALSARAKWAASESAQRASDLCLQVHGGWGYDVTTGIERYYRDARANSLYEGTNEIQKLLVARHAVATVV